MLGNEDRLGSRGKYYPYGEERSAQNPANDNVKFATYTRDGATGLDYADQRYYSSAPGRFLTPDRYRARAAVVDPQSWNRYAYVGGDPVNFIDHLGLDKEEPGGSTSYCDVYPDDPQCIDLPIDPLLAGTTQAAPGTVSGQTFDEVKGALNAARITLGGRTAFSSDCSGGLSHLSGVGGDVTPQALSSAAWSLQIADGETSSLNVGQAYGDPRLGAVAQADWDRRLSGSLP